jgi:UDP-N-acetylglucosamine--N-acetylmuramyl-(pentapeptide) pyrophosphoryl-undecaprenol N-acetylglucosamine transferase
MRVLLTGGTTGGHMYPALAVAEMITKKEPDSTFIFVGPEHEYGRKVIAEKEYEYRAINARAFDRKNMLANAAVAKDLVVSSFQIKKILDEFKPDVVIGTGGYVSTPVIREASKKGIPTFIHEQNAFPGVANKLASKYADVTYLAFSDADVHFPKAKKLVVSGNPIRRELLSAASMQYRMKLGIKAEEFCLLLFGGSRGAQHLNDVFTEMLIALYHEKNFRAFFITGADYFYEVLRKMDEAGVETTGKFEIMDYSQRMHELYSAADLVVSRAGALSVSEIAALGKASILIPSPNVSADHQTYNARTLSEHGAAILLPDDQVSTEGLTAQIKELAADREKLGEMADAAKAIGKIDAVDIIYDGIKEHLGKEAKKKKK